MDQVNIKATFRDDAFERLRYAQYAMQLIEEHPEERRACSIAIDAPWGVGKSTFLHMWINELDLGNPDFSAWQEFDPPYNSVFAGKSILPVYYNAWENDFSDNALASLLFSVCAQMEQRQLDGSFLPEDESKIINFISTCANLLTTILVYSKTDDEVISEVSGATAGMVSNSIMHIMSNYHTKKKKPSAQNRISAEYKKFQDIRDSFQEGLEELASLSDGVIIFIDELDRCKPSFAIDTLEAIKHYFNIPGLSFVFGLDMTELSHAVGGRYGHNMNTGGYLSKFFDYQIRMSTPTAEQMIKKDIDLIPNYSPELTEMLQDIFVVCGISPREVPLTLLQANTIWHINFINHKFSYSHIPYLCILALLCMKSKLPTQYHAYIEHNGNWNELAWQRSATKIYEYLSVLSTKLDDTAQSVGEDMRREIHSRYFNEKSDDDKAFFQMCYHLSLQPSESAPFRNAIHNMIELPYMYESEE